MATNSSDAMETNSEVPAGPAASTSGCPDKKPYFEIKKFNAVALWNYNISNDTCPICRCKLMLLCIECQADLRENQEDCPAAWGACSHAFHFHCISRWLRTNPNCPLDNRAWEFQRYGN